MPDLVLKDPTPGPEWFPFTDSRPVSELRAGAWLIRERWEAIAQGETRAVFGPEHLHGFVEDGVPAVEAGNVVAGPALIGLSMFAPTGIPAELSHEPTRLVHEAETVGWWVPDGTAWQESGADGDWDTLEVEGIPLRGAFDLVTALEHFLVADVADFVHEGGDAIPDGSVVIGDPSEVVLLGARIEPGVIFDVRDGAVVVEQHAYVKAGTRFEGPVYVGPGTQVLGGEIRWSALGPRCKVRGEIAHSSFLGYANKAHDGFVGHSVIGRWVNLGAGTVTSDLKNTYGPVRLDIRGTRIETGRQNLGSLIGDHAKTAIGTMLPTGATIGAGANVFGGVEARKFVAPFAWGADGGVMTREGFIAIAERVLPRRDVAVTDPVRSMLTALYDRATRR
jgi:UDP-N-acetylglucosamine diphosphorylase/glucosamine-1-phosphate N-acetyltransferase